MRWLVTLMLLVLVVVGGLWLVAGETILSAVGLKKTEPTTASSASVAAVGPDLHPDAIREITVTPAGGSTLTLTRTADGWTQPGNWPVREGVVTSLLFSLTGLRTLFGVIPLTGGDADLSKYGLGANQPVVEVKLDVEGGKALTLRFGRPTPAAGDSAFDLPTYLRVDSNNEVVKLGPDVYAAVARPAEAYRRRQLVPDAERVKVGGGEGTGRTSLLGDRYSTVSITKTDAPPVAFTLKRITPTPAPRRGPNQTSGEPSIAANDLATAWAVETPGSAQDRVDPAKLRAILTGLPDLWVESFVPAAEATPDKTGLDKPARTITITRADKKPSITVEIGNVKRTTTREEPGAPPMFPGAPPTPGKTVTEEYRFAKLKDSDLVFELKADKLNDLFADPAELRDPLLARFDTADVSDVAVAVKGKPPVAITRKKGNKDAEKDEDKQDRWYVGDVLAESGKVTELLDQLGKLEAKKDDRLDAADAAKLKELELDPAAGTRVTVTVKPRTADNEPAAPERKYTFVIGKLDPVLKKLPVLVAGWTRVNMVALKDPKEPDPLATPKVDKPPTVLDLIERPALAYRSRRLFDTAELKLETLTVTKDGAPAFALARVAKPAPAEGLEWQLTQPLKTEADDAKATTLTGDLSRLEVSDYVDESPKPDDLDKKYGLAKPKYSITLGFTGPGAKPQKLDVGNVREGKGDSYARLNGTGSVFAVAKTVPDAVEPGALGLLPLQLWQTTSDKINGIEIQREVTASEKYKLAQVGSEWKLSGPFDAAAGFTTLQPLLTAAAAVKADKYDALTADPAKHGLDKPTVRLTVTFKESKPGKPNEPPVESIVTKALLVGKETAPNSGLRFAKLDGSPNAAVFVIPDQLVKEADKPALGWLDRNVLAADPMKVTKVQVAGLTADAYVSLTKDDKGTWKADGTAFTVDGPTVNGLVFTVARPPVSRFAAYGPSVKWTDYGLDPPSATVTVTLSGDKPETHSIKLGKAEANGERYVRVDDGPAVGVVPARAAELLAKGKLDFVDRTMLNFDPAALTAVVRKKGKDELEVAQSGLNWEVTKPAKQKADKVLIEDLADQLSRLRATKVAAFAPTDLKPFGLDAPAAVVTLKVGADKPEDKVLKIGKPVDAAKPEGDRYAAAEVKGGPVTVGVIPGALANKLLGEPLKFRDRALAKFVDADKLTLERGDRKVTFEKKDGTWKLTSPVAGDAEQADLDDLVNSLADLRADEIEADKPADLKPFGLVAPEAKWKLFAGDKEVLSLLVGSKEKDGPRVYAKLEKGDLVTRLDPALSGKVLGEFRKRAVWSDLDASQAQMLVVSADSGTFQLAKGPAGWTDAQKPTDPIDGPKVDEVLAALAGLKAERFVADKDAKLNLYGLEKPSRVIVVTSRGGTPKTLQLGGPVGGSDGKQVYAKLPEKPEVFVLSAADTAKLTRDRAAFAGKK